MNSKLKGLDFSVIKYVNHLVLFSINSNSIHSEALLFNQLIILNYYYKYFLIEKYSKNLPHQILNSILFLFFKLM